MQKAQLARLSEQIGEYVQVADESKYHGNW
jgi:hypothetical protein